MKDFVNDISEKIKEQSQTQIVEVTSCSESVRTFDLYSDWGWRNEKLKSKS